MKTKSVELTPRQVDALMGALTYLMTQGCPDLSQENMDALSEIDLWDVEPTPQEVAQNEWD